MSRVGGIDSLCTLHNPSLTDLLASGSIGGEEGSLVSRNVSGVVSVLETSVVSVRSKGVGAGNGRQQKSDGGKCVKQHVDDVSVACWLWVV